jgi:hypothetical protein
LEKDIERKNIVKKPKSVKNYINGKDFWLCLVAYNDKIKECQETGKPKPQIPRYVGECIMKIAERLSTKFNFAQYPFREEMVLDAIEKMVESVEKYDVGYSTTNPNPLGYFTQVAWNQFIQRIQKEEKQLYIKHKNYEKMNILDKDDILREIGFDNEAHIQVIESFENPKPKAEGYTPHRNLDYSKNRKKKKVEV